jgi:hypothetical protein
VQCHPARGQVDRRLKREASSQLIPRLAQLHGCVPCWVVLSSVFNGALCFPGGGVGNFWKALCTSGQKRGFQMGLAQCHIGENRYKLGSQPQISI